MGRRERKSRFLGDWSDNLTGSESRRNVNVNLLLSVMLFINVEEKMNKEMTTEVRMMKVS